MKKFFLYASGVLLLLCFATGAMVFPMVKCERLRMSLENQGNYPAGTARAWADGFVKCRSLDEFERFMGAGPAAGLVGEITADGSVAVYSGREGWDLLESTYYQSVQKKQWRNAQRVLSLYETGIKQIAGVSHPRFAHILLQINLLSRYADMIAVWPARPDSAGAMWAAHEATCFKVRVDNKDGLLWNGNRLESAAYGIAHYSNTKDPFFRKVTLGVIFWANAPFLAKISRVENLWWTCEGEAAWTQITQKHLRPFFYLYTSDFPTKLLPELRRSRDRLKKSLS